MSTAITVVIPTRNRRALLEQTLSSVLRQQAVDLDVVVVDEASSDDTARYLATVPDPRVRTLRHPEARGAGAARNAGVAAADAPWIAFCDDDDLWAPRKLRLQLDALEAEPACGWVACGSVMVDESLRILDHQRAGAGGNVLARLCTINDIPGGGSGVVAGRDLVESAGGFREDEANSEDWDMWIRLAASSSLAVVDRPLVGYRIWSGSKSRSADRMVVAFDRITSRYAHLARECGVRPDVLAHRKHLAKQSLRSGDKRAASELYLEMATTLGWQAAWPRVPLARVAPSVLARLGDRRAAARVPVQWRAEADEWLGAFRTSGAASGLAAAA